MHFRLDGYGDRRAMNNAEYIRAFMVGAANMAGMEIVNGPNIHDFHRGNPDKQGITSLTMIAESHLALHTWPEQGRTSKEGWMTFDLASCKPFDNLRLRDYFMACYGIEVITFEDLHTTRGRPPLLE